MTAENLTAQQIVDHIEATPELQGRRRRVMTFVTGIADWRQRGQRYVGEHLIWPAYTHLLKTTGIEAVLTNKERRLAARHYLEQFATEMAR
jgi:hypothetical protein